MSVRKCALELIARAYTSISVQDASVLLGLSTDETVACTSNSRATDRRIRAQNPPQRRAAVNHSTDRMRCLRASIHAHARYRMQTHARTRMQTCEQTPSLALSRVFGDVASLQRERRGIGLRFDKTKLRLTTVCRRGASGMAGGGVERAPGSAAERACGCVRTCGRARAAAVAH